jgi:transcriptional regulator with XRE-family HTH domain
MAGRSPTVRRRRLGNELRRLRDAAGLTIEQVAENLECSSSKISRIETARVGATPRDVRDMLRLYGVTDGRLDELQQVAREGRQRSGWYAEYRGLPNWTLADLEAEAFSVEMYSALVIAGLLQTADYARAVLRAIRHDLKPEEIESRVELRLQRQARLAQEAPPTVWVVLDEAVLRRLIGGREVMRTQLDHLVKAAELPSVTLQVLPFSAGAHAGLDGEFTIINFPETVDPDVVYIENTMSDLYLDEPGAIRRYRNLFDHLRAAALAHGESVAFLASVAKEL